MARINLVVSDSQKNRWEKYSENQSEVDNISDLIRTSVENYISDDGDDVWTEEEIDIIIEYLDSIESNTTTLQSTLESVRDSQATIDEVKDMGLYQKASIKNVVREAVKEEMSEKNE